MTGAVSCISEQLQADDLRVRRSSLSPGSQAAAGGASGSGSEDDQPSPSAAETAAQPPAAAFSRLSQLLAGAPGGLMHLRCPSCSYETFSAACLQAHAKSHDGPPQPARRFHECDLCQMRFTNGANLRRHRTRHSGVKPYQCSVCGKRFFRRDHLLEHASTHVRPAGRQLPWLCPVCGKGFQRQIAMRAHYQNEHVRGTDGGETDWPGSTCRLCGYRATCSQSLHTHVAAAHGLAAAAAVSTHQLLAPVEASAEGMAAAVSPGQESPPGSPRPSQGSPVNCCSSVSQSSSTPATSSSTRSYSPPVVKHEPQEDEDAVDSQAAVGDYTDAAADGRRFSPEQPCLSSSTAGSDRVALAEPSRLRSLLLDDRRPASRSSADAGLQSLLFPKRPSSTNHMCTLCGILFPDQTLYFMHKGCHAETNPWKCNICSQVCHNVYEFNSHLLSQSHR